MFIKTATEKHIACNQRILKDFPCLWATSTMWDLESVAITIHSLELDGEGRYNLACALGSLGESSTRKIWLHFSNGAEHQMVEVAAKSKRYWRVAFDTARTLTELMPRECIVLDCNEHNWPTTVHVYRFPQEQASFYRIISAARDQAV